MIVVGLTGSIAMGKSTAADMLRRDGCPVFDADVAVHTLLSAGGAAVAPVLVAFPDVGDGQGGIARDRLGATVFADVAGLRWLEAILHPLVRRAQHDFLTRYRGQRRKIVVLDVPLLFESGGDARCDVTIVVSAPAFLQKQRALRRPGMTEGRFLATLDQQMLDGEKRRRATYVVHSGLGTRRMRCELRCVMAKIERSGARL